MKKGEKKKEAVSEQRCGVSELQKTLQHRRVIGLSK
jgi:hypothetical protein